MLFRSQVQPARDVVDHPVASRRIQREGAPQVSEWWIGVNGPGCHAQCVDRPAPGQVVAHDRERKQVAQHVGPRDERDRDRQQQAHAVDDEADAMEVRIALHRRPHDGLAPLDVVGDMERGGWGRPQVPEQPLLGNPLRNPPQGPLLPAAEERIRLVHDTLAGEFGFTLVPYWVWNLAFVGLVAYVMWAGVQISTRVQLALSLISAAVVLLFFVDVILNAPAQDLSVFTPAASEQGWGGILFGVLYGVLIFVGFETAANLAEETAEPKRSTATFCARSDLRACSRRCRPSSAGL